MMECESGTSSAGMEAATTSSGTNTTVVAKSSMGSMKLDASPLSENGTGNENNEGRLHVDTSYETTKEDANNTTIQKSADYNKTGEPSSSSLSVAQKQRSNSASSSPVEEQNNCTSSAEGGSLSPTSLRRSTRVCALQAQKKLKLKDGMVEGQPLTEPCAEKEMIKEESPSVAATKAKSQNSKKLKRKLTSGWDLDQYDCKFGIRLDSDDDVLLMSDESEVSSLDDEDVADLRQRYNEAKKYDVSDDVKLERQAQIRELEVALQLEEAKLAMLKKIRLNQHQAIRNAENARRMMASHHQNASGATYKPPMASTLHNSAKVNGTSSRPVKNVSGHKSAANSSASNSAANNNNNLLASLQSLSPQQAQILQQILSRVGNQQQIMQILKTLTPAALTAFVQQSQAAAGGAGGGGQNSQAQGRDHHNHHHQQQQSSVAGTSHHHQQQSSGAAAAAAVAAKQAATQQQQAAAAAAAALAAKNQAAAAETLAAKQREVRAINAQRIDGQRKILRHRLEQQLLAALAPPKPPVPDLSFIPNGNQLDFCYLLGLDLTVQRVRKDKAVFKKPEFDPYTCEECGTDFTPSWKAIADDKGEYHLYCEHCIRQAQKRKVRQNHMELIKKAFQSMRLQEKEFEKQVEVGKFSDPIPTTIQFTPTTNSSAAISTISALNSANNSGSTPRGGGGTNHHHHAPNAVGSSGGFTPQQHHLAAKAGHSTVSSPASSSQSSQQRSTSQQQSLSQQQQQQQKAKRTSTGSGSGPNAAAATAAMNAMANNPILAQQLMAAAMRSNPLLAAMITSSSSSANSPAIAQQLLSQMIAQQQQQQQQQQQNHHNQQQRSSTSSQNQSQQQMPNNLSAGMSALLQNLQQAAAANSSNSNSSSSSTNHHGSSSSSQHQHNHHPHNNQASSSSSSLHHNQRHHPGQSSNSTNTSSSSKHGGGNSGNSGGAGNNSMAALNNLFSFNAQLHANPLMNNPQLFRQFQQVQFAQQMRDLAAKKK